MSAERDIWSSTTWPDGWNVRHVRETGSTNADLLAALEAGTADDRSVLATDHQTAGRGRLDRRWDAPPGANLLVSIALSPVPAVPADVTHRVGLAALAAVRELRPELSASLKWPNDVLIGDRKLAGILAQRSALRDAVVVGLGLNVGWAPDGAALLGDSEIAMEVADVLAAVLRAFDAQPADIHAAYREALSTIGRDVRVELPAGQMAVTGRAVDVDDVGRLVVDIGAGAHRSFDVGDVVHLRAT